MFGVFFEGFSGLTCCADAEYLSSSSSILFLSRISEVQTKIRLLAEFMNLLSNLAAELSSNPGETYS